MSPEAFKQWLAEMKSAGLARSDIDAVRQLGYSAPNTATKLKREGASRQVALACTALLHRMRPYGE